MFSDGESRNTFESEFPRIFALTAQYPEDDVAAARAYKEVMLTSQPCRAYEEPECEEVMVMLQPQRTRRC